MSLIKGTGSRATRPFPHRSLFFDFSAFLSYFWLKNSSAAGAVLFIFLFLLLLLLVSQLYEDFGHSVVSIKVVQIVVSFANLNQAEKEAVQAR